MNESGNSQRISLGLTATELLKENPIHLRLFSLFIVISVIVGLIIYKIKYIWSGGVDLAHHYALVYRISDLLSLPVNDPTLDEMNLYPPLSHILAAITGKVLGSSFLGLQVVTLASIILLWASIASMVNSLPVRRAFSCFLLLSAALVLNRRYMHVEIHGYEVVSSFFYAQLVGQAMLFGLLAFMIRNEQSEENPIFRYLVLLLFLPILQWTHLMPALELFGLLFFLMAIDLIQATAEDRKKKFFVACLIMLVASASIVFHPSLAAMSEISRNNGSVSFLYTPTLSSFVFLCIFVICTSAALLFKWFNLSSEDERTRYTLFKYTSLYGLVVSGLCILQCLALYFGHGSEYAIKKYGFALNTALLMNIVMLVVSMLSKEKSSKPSGSVQSYLPAFCYVATPLFIIISVLSITPKSKAVNVSRVIELNKQLDVTRFTELQHEDGKYDFAINIEGVPSAINYMFTIANLNTPRAHLDGSGSNRPLYDILVGKMPGDFSRIENIITSENALPYDIKACRVSKPSGSLVIVNGECVGRHLSGSKASSANDDSTTDGLIHGDAHAKTNN